MWPISDEKTNSKAFTFGAVTRFALFFLLITFSAQAQETSWDIEAAPMAGILLPHHEDMLYLRAGHVVGMEVSLTKRTDGSKDWHHRYFFPRWGVSVNAYDLGSPYMGNGYGGRIFFDLPMTKARNFFLKVSFGAGWIEKPFDLDDNPRNSAIGSHLNAALGVEAHFNLNLGEKWAFRPGIGIHHYSNGAMQAPNSGINLALIRMAFMHRFAPRPLPELRTPTFSPTKGNFIIGVSGGMKEIKPIGGKKYGVLNIFGIYQKRVSGKSSFGGEVGVNYNESLQYANDDGDQDNPNSQDNYRPYIAGIYQLHFDPLSIRLSVGSYIAPRYTDDGLIFLRYHLVYDLKRIQFFLGLKSHYAKADNGEIGIAYRLK
ncbi:MAG: hypothetical protein ACI9O2_000667 [Flammeovirgaceae bacterium]